MLSPTFQLSFNSSFCWLYKFSLHPRFPFASLSSHININSPSSPQIWAHALHHCLSFFILNIRNTSPLLCLPFPFTPLFSCLPSLREFSNNRSLDNLDCIGGTGSSLPRWDDDDFSQACSTLGRRSCIGQVSICRGRDEKSEKNNNIIDSP